MESTNGAAAPKMFTLLHTFKGHNKAVTALRLHPVSGLAISTSLDGFVKVLNLEALNELFCFQVGTGIMGMRIINIGLHHHGILMSTTDASIKLWKITSVCDFFGVASAPIAQLEIFENLEAELELHHRQKRKELLMHGAGFLMNEDQQTEAAMALADGEKDSQQAVQKTENTDSSQQKPTVALRAAIVDSATENLANSNAAESADEEGGETAAAKSATLVPEKRRASIIDLPETAATTTTAPTTTQNASNVKTPGNTPATAAFDGGDISDRIIVTYSSQDLRAFTHNGVLLGRLEPEHVVEGIKDFCVSVYQKLLICLCEGDRIRVFDLRRFTFPLLHEFTLRGPVNPSASMNNSAGGPPNTVTSVLEDLGLCCELVDVAPAVALRAPRFTSLAQELAGAQGSSGKTDARGMRVPDYIECYLLIGLKNGAILFLDTLNNFEVQMNFQASNGVVLDMKYRRRQRELLVLGQDFSQTFSTIRIWRLPDMDFLGEVVNLTKISCFSISPSLNFFAVGLTDGNVRLFNHDPETTSCREIMKAGESHHEKVSSLTFCDELRIYFTCSVDGRVKIWDYEKRLVRTIALNQATCAVVSNGSVGDVVMAQNHYLLTIPKRIWDEDDILLRLRAEFESLAAEEIPEHILAEIKLKKSTAANKAGATEDSNESDNNNNPNQRTGNTDSENDEDDDSRNGNKERKKSQAPPLVKAPPPTTDRRASRMLRHVVTDPNKANNGDGGDANGDGNNADSIVARKTSASILVTSRRKASMSMALHSAHRDSNGNSVAVPAAHRRSALGANDITAHNGNNPGDVNNPAGGSSQEPATTSNGHPGTNSNSSTSGNNSSQDVQQERQRRILEELERDVILPSLGQHQQLYKHVSRANNAQLLQQKQREKDKVNVPPGQATQSQSQSVVLGDEASSIQWQAQTSDANTNIYDPSPALGDDDERSKDILDVLHPRFLVHDKPPARLVQLADLENHLRRLQIQQLQQHGPPVTRKLTSNGNNANVVTPPPQPQNIEDVPHTPGRRPAQFGLSPRAARLTLLHASPFAHHIPATIAMATSTANNSSSSVGSGRPSGAGATVGIEAIQHQQQRQLRAQQEKVMVSMAIGMKVSTQYQQHRATLKEARQQRQSVMAQRLSVVHPIGLSNHPFKQQPPSLPEQQSAHPKRNKGSQPLQLSLDEGDESGEAGEGEGNGGEDDDVSKGEERSIQGSEDGHGSMNAIVNLYNNSVGDRSPPPIRGPVNLTMQQQLSLQQRFTNKQQPDATETPGVDGTTGNGGRMATLSIRRPAVTFSDSR